MQIYRLGLIVLAAIVASQSVRADDERHERAEDARHERAENARHGVPPDTLALGEGQGVFDYCTSIDRTDDPLYDRQARDLFKGLGEDTVESIRRNPQFWRGYKIIQSVLRELPVADALTSCRALIGKS